MTATPRWTSAFAAATVGAALLIVPAGPAPDTQTCPPGQHEDTQSPGFQCVSGWCPAGTLLDGVTHSCVAAPGEPPPPLPSG